MITPILQGRNTERLRYLSKATQLGNGSPEIQTRPQVPLDQTPGCVPLVSLLELSLSAVFLTVASPECLPGAARTLELSILSAEPHPCSSPLPSALARLVHNPWSQLPLASSKMSVVLHGLSYQI